LRLFGGRTGVLHPERTTFNIEQQIHEFQSGIVVVLEPRGCRQGVSCRTSLISVVCVCTPGESIDGESSRAELVGFYFQEVRTYIPMIQEGLARVKTGEKDPDSLSELFRLFPQHQGRGLAGAPEVAERGCAAC
jgi:hypothetical protein